MLSSPCRWFSIAGSRHFTDYPLLRATHDAFLAHCLPDVELLTIGGRGVPMLVASYATARRLLELVERRDVPVHVIGRPKQTRRRRGAGPEDPGRGLPD